MPEVVRLSLLFPLTLSVFQLGLMKCPGGLQCPVCASPNSLQEQGLFDQTTLLCTSPFIPSPGKEAPLESELSEIQSSETFREPLGSVSLGLSDQQGNNVDLSCNITYSTDSQDIAPLPDLSLLFSSPLPLALSLSLDCPVERQSYEKLWRILAYYSETAVRLEREIMLSKAPALAYRYRQVAETDGYYHTGVKASLKARPQWLLQPAISIQLNRAQSNGYKVQLVYSTRVSAHPDPTSHLSASSPASHPWVLIPTNHTTTALAAVAGSKVELSCPLLSSGSAKVQWILPDGFKLISPSSSLDGRLRASVTGLLLQKVQLSDAGIYYCVARAGKDIDVLPLRLAVEDSSVPLSEEHVGLPVTGTVGELVSLSCKVSGSPQPHMSWILPDGNILRRGLAISGGLILASNGTLSLPILSLRDAGHYRCVAVNQYGSDSLSIQLILNTSHIPPLRTSFPRGPQSAAGRSTKIRAPLLHQVDEGSGDEEEEEKKTVVGNKRRPASPHPNRRYPTGKPQKRGPVREGPLRRGGGPISSTDQRRNRFENRHRVTTNKKRIDPQKWADLLAKIRHKTVPTNSQAVTTAKPTVDPSQEGKYVDTRGHEGDNDTESGRAQEEEVEVETEGSSVDDAVLQEERLQPIQTAHAETKTKTETETDGGTARSTEKAVETENETETQTETAVNPVPQKGPVTSPPVSGTNEIVPETAEGDEQGANPTPSGTRPLNPRKGIFPNLVPNLRPQSPWNSRRKIGQRRRIINRPRGRPLTPPRPLPGPTTPGSQTVTPDTRTDQIKMLSLVSTTPSPAILLTPSDQIKTATNRALPYPTSTPASKTHGISPSPFHLNTHTVMTTHSVRIPDTEVTSPFNTTALPHSNIVTSGTHVPDPNARSFTHGTQTHTETQKQALGKHVDRPPSKQSEELQRIFMDVPGEPLSTAFHHFTIITTPQIITTPSIALRSTAAETDPTITTVTTTPTMPATTTIFIPTASPSRYSTTHPIPASTSPTTTYTTQTSSTTFSLTTDSSSPSSTTFSFSGITGTLYSTTTATSTTTSNTPTTVATPADVHPTNTSATTVSSISSTTTTTTRATSSTKASSRDRPNVGQADPRGRPVPAVPNQSRSPTGWKNPGANSIPDSHSSRSTSSVLPAVPGVSLNQLTYLTLLFSIQ